MKSMINYSSLFHINQIHQKGYLGDHVGIAILDTGSFLHRDLKHLVYFHDYVNQHPTFYDDSGHGTHVAGIIGSSKLGVAPRANLIILKVLNQDGEGKTSHVLQALEWIIHHKEQYRIRIVNISIGSASRRFHTNQALLDGVNRVWDSGIIVTSAAGNRGPKSQTITNPGISPKIITVGSCDDNIVNSNRLYYSGRGPTSACVKKPDVVAPGSHVLSCSHKGMGYVEKSGTSMATPYVSGVIALLLSKEPNLTPKEVKLRIYETSIDIGRENNQQGWGLINPRGLLKV